MHHRTCLKKIDRKGVLSCDTCLVSDDRDSLLPFQYDVAMGKNTHPIVQVSECAKYSVEISAEPSEPVVLLPCIHMVHFECIDNNKRKLCSKCPTDFELEKEG